MAKTVKNKREQGAQDSGQRNNQTNGQRQILQDNQQILQSDQNNNQASGNRENLPKKQGFDPENRPPE